MGQQTANGARSKQIARNAAKNPLAEAGVAVRAGDYKIGILGL
jgi:hypothetical protein